MLLYELLCHCTFEESITDVVHTRRAHGFRIRQQVVEYFPAFPAGCRKIIV
jgi:hypothetical protein